MCQGVSHARHRIYSNEMQYYCQLSDIFVLDGPWDSLVGSQVRFAIRASKDATPNFGEAAQVSELEPHGSSLLF